MTEQKLRATFSENIKKYRELHHLSQVKLARKAEVSINFINDLEAGKKWASPATMVKLANCFDIDAYELMKPSGSLPDNLNGILKEYTETVHNVLENTRRTFLESH